MRAPECLWTNVACLVQGLIFSQNANVICSAVALHKAISSNEHLSMHVTMV